MDIQSQLERTWADPSLWLYDLAELRRVVPMVKSLNDDVGAVTLPVLIWRGDVAHVLGNLLARSLLWYTRPVCEFNGAVVGALQEILIIVESLSTKLVVLERRLAEAEVSTAEPIDAVSKHTGGQSGKQLRHVSVEIGQYSTAKAKNEREVAPLSNSPRPECQWLHGGYDLRSVVSLVEMLNNEVGEINPRPPGWHNDVIQILKKLMADSLSWYTRPIRKFTTGVSRSFQETFCAVENLSTNLAAIELRSARFVNKIAALRETTGGSNELHKNESDQACKPLLGSRQPNQGPCSCSIDELRGLVARIEEQARNVGALSRGQSGWQDFLVQPAKKLAARSLEWLTRPLREFSALLSQSLFEILHAVDYLLAETLALEEQLTRSRGLSYSMSIKTGATTSSCENSRRCSPMDVINDRTTYIIGLFGTGRLYINDLIMQYIGKRSKHFWDQIRLHPGPTSMIYSGHATLKYASSGQAPPSVTNALLQTVDLRFADLIFIRRHPLDSLLTNWVWWRTFLRENKMIPGISSVYRDLEELSIELERNFQEFELFAKGDPAFFAAAPNTRFLCFVEFVEETELYVEKATLSVCLEDFAIDARTNFSKIAEVMSVDVDLGHGQLEPPRTRPYRYLRVAEDAPKFRSFISGLDSHTKRRIEKIGYALPT